MNPNESEKRFGIVRPAIVPDFAVALPPNEPEPAPGAGITSQTEGESTVRKLALQVAMENARALDGWRNRVKLWKELRMDPPYPAAPVALRTQYFLAADAAGKTDQEAAGWTHGVPQDFVFPAGQWYWIWDI